MREKTYAVAGMTCGHCVQAVKTEVAKLPHVTDVDVDLSSGRLTVVSDQPVGDEAVRAAVEESGYEVSG